MATNLENLELLVNKLLSLNAKSPGWNGMNARNAVAVPGGSSATDLINRLHMNAIEYAKLIRNHAKLADIQIVERNIEGCLRTLVVLEQLDSETADKLIDGLHDIIELYTTNLPE